MFHSSKLVAALGMLLLLAAAASAQNQPTTYINDAYVDNQGTVNTCSAGENVNLNGTTSAIRSLRTQAETTSSLKRRAT
jgi:hypothetical protein